MAGPTDDTTRPQLTKTARSRRWRETAIELLLLLAASLAIVVTAAIIYTLVEGTISFFQLESTSVTEFFTSATWSQSAGSFGVYPLVVGTFLIAGGAIFLGGGLGVAAALYLAEFASEPVRAVGKPLVEVLAGVPSIVYGFFALLTITPYLQEHVGADYFNALSATIVISVMTLPIVVSLSDDAIRSVPDDLRDASLALGATEWETSVKTVLPAARSGVFASLFLGLARALGETMAVTLAAGTVANSSLNLLEAHQTMTAYIAQVATGDIPPGAGVQAAFAVGLLLFVITYGVNWGGQVVLERFQGDYA